MKDAKKNKKDQPKEVKIGFSSNNKTPKIVSKKSSSNKSSSKKTSAKKPASKK